MVVDVSIRHRERRVRSSVCFVHANKKCNKAPKKSCVDMEFALQSLYSTVIASLFIGSYSRKFMEEEKIQVDTVGLLLSD